MAEAARDDLRELVVDQPFVDELERRGVHGVHAGDRVRLQLLHGAVEEKLPAYFGSFDSGAPDLAERAEEILRAEFPGQ